jgi:prepilin-type N-terminal cleavage/methylation domain-containing protein
MQTPRAKQKTGFTIVEVMVSLVILAILTTAVAFTFDAAVTNYQANQGIYETVNRSRQALMRITNDLRTASAVALIGEDPDNSQVSLVTLGGKDITYRFDSATSTLYYDDNVSGNSYVLCDNVASATFDRTSHEIERGGGNITAVRDVRIVLTLTDDSGDTTQTVAAATLIRKNL